jgi:hypothetical protein
MKTRARSFLLLLALLLPVLLPSNSFAAEPLRESSYQDTRGEGKAIVEDLLTRRPAEGSQILGLLKIRPPDADIIEIPVRMSVRLAEDGWLDVYETQPVGEKPGEVFIVKHRGLQPNEYLYGTYKDPNAKADLKPLSRAELYRPLAGSDFSLIDLGLDFLHWPSQKIVKKEMRKSRSCRVVESTNPDPKPGAYSRVLTWIDFETSGIILAEAYDHHNRLLKEFSIQKFDRKEKRLKEMQIRNDQTDSRTRLELNLELDP